MFVAMMPVTSPAGTIETVDPMHVFDTGFQPNVLYYSPQRDSHFQVCVERRGAETLVRRHRIRWN